MARKRRLKNGAAPQVIRRTAIRMADVDGMARGTGRGKWKVVSESSLGSWHMVVVTEGGIVCDCGYHQERGGAACKHSMAAEITIAAGGRGGRARRARHPLAGRAPLAGMRVGEHRVGRDAPPRPPEGGAAVSVQGECMRGPVLRRAGFHRHAPSAGGDPAVADDLLDGDISRGASPWCWTSR